ncbi:C-type lectin domain family 4 member M-like [Polypterus senegalus]|uniref:C-type lectin domain family 4 member M-like n=1 Tax=Polypterus senegalus TaxID=55291 RepID=UPI001962B95D|nr:C-type lectin domain family 4 member M-like [Polypterus senegalus]
MVQVNIQGTGELLKKTPSDQDGPKKRSTAIAFMYVTLAISVALSLVILAFFIIKSSRLEAEIEDMQLKDLQMSSELKKLDMELSRTSSETSAKLKNLEMDLERQDSQIQDLQTKDSEMSLRLSDLEDQLREVASGRGPKTDDGPVMDDFFPIYPKLQPHLPDDPDWRSFNGHHYYFSKTTTNWAEAKEWCRSRDSYLVVISSSEEKTFISRSMTERSWVGLSDSEAEGVWKWTTGESVQGSFWAKGEPNDDKNNEDCGEIMNNDYLNDSNCEDRKYWVCEKDFVI